MSDGLNWADCPLLESVPGKVSGAWVFRGTRLPVSTVLANIEDMTPEEIAEEFPSVTPARVREILQFLANSADRGTRH